MSEIKRQPMCLRAFVNLTFEILVKKIYMEGSIPKNNIYRISSVEIKLVASLTLVFKTLLITVISTKILNVAMKYIAAALSMKKILHMILVNILEIMHIKYIINAFAIRTIKAILIIVIIYFGFRRSISSKINLKSGL